MCLCKFARDVPVCVLCVDLCAQCLYFLRTRACESQLVLSPPPSLCVGGNVIYLYDSVRKGVDYQLWQGAGATQMQLYYQNTSFNQINLQTGQQFAFTDTIRFTVRPIFPPLRPISSPLCPIPPPLRPISPPLCPMPPPRAVVCGRHV